MEYRLQSIIHFFGCPLLKACALIFGKLMKMLHTKTSNVLHVYRHGIYQSVTALIGPSTPEKAAVVTVGTTDHSSSPQLHHQITITTGNMNATPESRCIRRNSFKRSSPSWVLDPKRVLFFFATL